MVARASPLRFVLQHETNAGKLQYSDAFVIGMGLEEADWGNGSP